MWTTIRALTDSENIHSWASHVEKEIAEKEEEFGPDVTAALRKWFESKFIHNTTMKSIDKLFKELTSLKKVAQYFFFVFNVLLLINSLNYHILKSGGNATDTLPSTKFWKKQGGVSVISFTYYLRV